jgi:2-aminoadipate transaminase
VTTIADPPARTVAVARRVQELAPPQGFAGVFGALPPDTISLLGGNPASDALPVAGLAAATERLFAEPARAQAALKYAGAQGQPELRAWLGHLEGVDADRIVITNGGLHALQLPVLASVDPGEPVVVDNPIYPTTLRVLELAGAQPQPIDVGPDGLDVDELERRLAAGLRPAAVYTVADFQNPSGAVLPGAARGRLVDLAERYGFLVLSDNPYRLSRFAGEAEPDFDTDSDRVVRTNTFSKTLGPGLRLGWLVLPAWLVPAVLQLRSRTDQHPSTFTQAVVGDLLSTDGAFEKVLADLRETHRERATVLDRELAARLPGVVAASRPDGGFFTWARLQDPQLSVEQVQAAAAAAGVLFAAGGGFDASGAGRHRDRIRFGYSDTRPEDIVTAVDRLTRVVGELGRGTR